MFSTFPEGLKLSAATKTHWVPYNKRATCGGMWCDVMAASSGLLQGVGVCVQECEGLRG